MQAWCVTQHGDPAAVLQLQERTLPAPGPGEVQLSVNAAALGLPDVLMCRGRYEFKPDTPFTPGQDVCGVVTAVGEGVSLCPGERVLGVSSFFLGYGSLAQACMSMQDMLYPVPDGMTDTEAAAFGIAYQTAWIALVERAALRAGQTLLVLGAAGGSGSAAIQLGRALGARVIAVAGSADRCARCRELGAEYSVDYRTEDLVSRVRELTGGAGADIVFDPVGGELAPTAAGAMARGGRLLAVGFAAGQWGDVAARDLALANIDLVGVYAGGYTAQERQAFHRDLCARFDSGDIAPVIGSETPFTEVPAALQALEQSRVVGKIVTRPT